MEEIKSTVEHLQDLIDAREDMKTSINNKGVQVSGGLKSYADAIDRIPQTIVNGDDLNVGDINVEYTKNGSYNINPTDYELDALSGVGVNINVPTKKVGMNATPIEITKNGIGLYKAKDYSKFDGLSTVSIKVDVPKDVNVGTGSVEYTENGSYTIKPSDYSVDALSSVGVNVNVPTKKVGMNMMPIEITENGLKMYNAKDYSNYDGLSTVNLMVRVPTKTLSTASKEYTENGSYTIDASDYSVDGLSQVELEINVPQGGGSGGNYEIDFTRIGYSLEESKIANEANVISINNAMNRLDEWNEYYTDYNNWSFIDPDKPDNGETKFRFSPWHSNDSVIIAPPIYNLNSDGKLVNSSYFYQNDDRIGIFRGASALRYISPLDTSKVTDMESMFMGCTSLTAVPQLDTSKVTNMQYMFEGCTSLTTIPQLDTSNVIYIGCMFYDCGSLTTIPQLDTSKVVNMVGMFARCTSLTSVPLLDASNVNDMGGIFERCTSLENMGGFKNLKVNLDLSYGCPNITLDSFENIVNNVSTVEQRRLSIARKTADDWIYGDDSGRFFNLRDSLVEKGWTLEIV